MEISPEISFTLHYWPDANGKPKNQDATVSHSKLLYQFVVFVEAYPYSKNQHHSSIQSWYIVDVILRITFGRSGYAWPHPYKSTESDRCICVLLSTYKKSLWACLTIPTRNDRKNLLFLLILHHMQKTNFITQPILKIKLTHYSSWLWACLYMTDHIQLKQPTNICCFHGLLVTSKNSASTYLWDILL